MIPVYAQGEVSPTRMIKVDQADVIEFSVTKFDGTVAVRRITGSDLVDHGKSAFNVENTIGLLVVLLSMGVVSWLLYILTGLISR